MGLGTFSVAAAALKNFPFDERRGETLIVREPIGVCGLITPWNWPLFLIAAKVAPALATGCTVVLKPSEVAPFTGKPSVQIMDAAGVPAGVFNLVQGTGEEVGVALSAHPGIDMISFTGSTRAGIEVARNAAPTVKRVQQELGGKVPISFWTTRALQMGSPAEYKGSWAIPANPATRPPGCWSRLSGWMRPLKWPELRRRRSRLANLVAARRSGLWFLNCNGTRFKA